LAGRGGSCDGAQDDAKALRWDEDLAPTFLQLSEEPKKIRSTPRSVDRFAMPN